MAQEIENVKDVVKLLVHNETKIASVIVQQVLGNYDDVKDYRYWGFNIRCELLPATAPLQTSPNDIYVYHSHDGIAWGLVEYIQNTEHPDFSKKYRKQRRYYAMTLVLLGGDAQMTVSTIMGNS